jgi:hypothetical protein
MTQADAAVDVVGSGGRERIDWGAFRALLPEVRTARGRRGRQMRNVAMLLWSVALLVVFFTWNGASSQAYLALQAPYFASGALTVAVLCAIAATLFLSSFLADAIEQMQGTPGEE